MTEKQLMNKAITLITEEENTIEEIRKKANALIRHLKYYSDKKNWEGRIILVGSEHKANVAIKIKDNTYKKGRPRELFYEPKGWNCKTKPHIHIALLDAYPCNSITKKINKYWTEREGKGNTHFKAMYRKKGFIEYMKSQASFTRKANL